MAKNKPTTKPPPKAKGKDKAKKPAAAKAPKEKAPKLPRKNGKIDWAAPETLAVYDRETTKIGAERERGIELLKRDWDIKKEQNLNAKKAYETARTDLEVFMREREEQRGKAPTSPGNLFAAAEANERAKELQKKASELQKENKALADRVKADEERAAKEAENRKKVQEIVAGVAGATKMPTAADDAKPGKDEWYPDDLFKRVPIAKFKAWGLTDNDVKILVSGDMKDNRPAFPMPTLGDVNAFSNPDPKSGYQRRMADLKGFGQASIDRWEKAHESFWAWWDKKANKDEFARECGYKPFSEILETPVAPKADAPAADAAPAETPAKTKLRGGGAKPKAEPKPKKGKKGVKADGPASGPDGDSGKPGDGATGQPGKDEFGFPNSYSDPPEPGEDGDGEAE